jgi:hypothetical protein
MHGLREMLSPVNELLKSDPTGVKGAMFEDNLSVMQFWKSELDQFVWSLVFFPANMTMILQQIDRHIGIRYKEAVYREYRKNCFQRMEASNDSTIQPFTQREKQIMITRAFGDIHDKLSSTDVFE